MQPSISIIIPTYNRAHLIAETLDSIIAQSYTEWECIIVDDGSTDATEVLLSGYVNIDPRFQYHQRPPSKPKGANACRNYGLQLVKGAYVVFFDSDDVMHRDKLLKQVQVLESNDLPFSVCQSLIFKDRIENIIRLKSLKIQSSHSFNDFISSKIIIPIQAPVFRKEFLELNQYRFDEDLQAGQEWYFIAKILFDHPHYVPLNEPLDYIRSHPHNISNMISNEKMWHYYLARLKLYQDLKSELASESLHILHVFFLYMFKKFVRTGQFKNAWSVWTTNLLKVKKLSFKDHVRLLIALILFILFGKGDGILSKVSLNNALLKKSL